MKYAVCIYGQLRAVETVIGKLHENLLEPLKADLFLVVQTTGTQVDNHINLFQTANKFMYESPDCSQIFVNYDYLYKNDNYIYIPALKVYYNCYKIAEIFGDIFEKNYDYIILTRSDYLHLFPFPDIDRLYGKNDFFWCYDGHEWGGINGSFMYIPSQFIIKYLCAPWNCLQDSNNIERLNSLSLNCERFLLLLFQDNNWKLGKIQPNAFLTASSYNEITTWSGIQYSHTYNVFYKYDDQMNRAFHSLSQYNNNEKWFFEIVYNYYIRLVPLESI